jgi:hypothetical protein
MTFMRVKGILSISKTNKNITKILVVGVRATQLDILPDEESAS